MQTQMGTKARTRTNAVRNEKEVRARIEALSYLPTAVEVATKLIELGKDENAEPAAYAKVISADASLSSRLLALANSSYLGVRHQVTSVKLAVNLLGLATVRSLTLTYCMAGLYNELRLTAEEGHMFWEASLCKALASKHYARMQEEKMADEAFACGLFQDFAIPIMYAVAKTGYLSILKDSTADWKSQLERERQLFGADHTVLGRVLAQKLELPEVFVDAVAFHHDFDSLSACLENGDMGGAVYAASLFPHLLDAWTQGDAEELRSYLQRNETGDLGNI